jgi:G3E family GTPase
MPSPTKTKARYIMIGGFLGAGKTTAVAKLAQRLSQRGLKVGLITNDQGRELVDTKMLRSKGFATEEIPGGCFCCRFNSLVDAADKLTASTQPDVFVAEPVGSCTDLVATVTYPLRRIYGDSFLIAPVSVLLDPIRAARVLGLEGGGNFSEKVVYIYKKQLEEADIIVINKTDLLAPSRVEELRAALAREFPRAEIVAVSTRDETNLDAWFSRLESGEQSNVGTMEVDYDVYADGEALLGWLNATVRLAGAAPFDAEKVITLLARSIQEHLKAQHAEVAHLKMTYSPDEALAGEIAAVNLVRNDFVPELSLKLQDPSSGGQLIINLRAENAPEALAVIVRESLGHLERDVPGLTAGLEHLEHFRPGRPTPTHRDVASSTS